MGIWSYIVPFAYLVLLESLTVRWVAGNTVPGLVSRVFATNVAGLALLLFIAMTGWFFGWWPDIRNWALRDTFFLFLLIKAPIFAFLFRRWGTQRIFTLHVLSNFVSAITLSLLFIYFPIAMAVRPVTVDQLNEKAVQRVKQIQYAVEAFKVTHGYYPGYIWGGDMISWKAGKCPDPLLNQGYLTAYPVNPLNLRRTFFEPRRVPGWKELWFGYKSAEFLEVRSLWEPLVDTDARFGYRGAKMGNVLPDPRYPQTRLPDNVKFTRVGHWLPGGFFYRSYDFDKNGFADAYILGVCGDEAYQTGADIYDARLDTLAGDRTEGGTTGDRIRDGVKYIHRAGFKPVPSPLVGQRVPWLGRPAAPEGGEVSAGETEPDVKPPVDEGEENVE